MTDNIFSLVQPVGDGVTLNADEILEEAKGKYRQVVIIGEPIEDEDIHVCATHSVADALMLVCWAQAFLVGNRGSMRD